MSTSPEKFRRAKPSMNGTCREIRRPQNEEFQEVLIMRTRLTLGAAIFTGAASILLLMSPIPAVAHHAFAADFDANKPVKFIGATVTKVMLTNPHSWIYVDVMTPDGKIEN